MAQPPPRKGAYNKTVTALHKEQLANIQAKNQQESDLLDDIKAFMKQKSTIEKNYAEGLLKLSAVYGTKKIACKLGLEQNQGDDSGDQDDSAVGDKNIYKIWKRVLEENEKIANLRLAAAQVFQENISDDAKNLRAIKNVTAKKYLDRFVAIQKEVQISVNELDRTRLIYFSEESDAIRVASQAEEAELKAKGKKKDVLSIFQSQTALEKQAGKLCAKQEELNIKSTGARNDYLLAVETANAHQERYYHFDLNKTLEGMEGTTYEKISEYLGTLSATELATCNAANGSYSKIRDQSKAITREYNYQCYLKAYSSLSDHVQYAFEPVEGDTINTITMQEDDAGLNYALTREAREAAEKYNNAIKMISAFRKRINALYKAKKKMENPDPSIDEKVEELENTIQNAETEKGKAEARLNKLKEGGVSVDKYLDTISVCSDANKDVNDGADDWDTHVDTPPVEEVNYFSYDQISYGEAPIRETAVSVPAGDNDAWGATEDWGETTQEESTDRGQAAGNTEQQPCSVTNVDGETETVKAIALYTFAGQNEDELAVTENEEIILLVKECEEEGWAMAQNLAGKKGLVPSSFVQALNSEQDPGDGFVAAVGTGQKNANFSPSIEPLQQVLTIPSCPPPDVEEDSSFDEDTEDDDTDDDGPPPGLAPPPGPPPLLAPIIPSSNVFRSLYDFTAGQGDELSLQVDDLIKVTSRTPNGDEDGWWKGECNGKTGLFPSSYVEECKETNANALIVEEKKDNNSLDEEPNDVLKEVINKEESPAQVISSDEENNMDVISPIEEKDHPTKSSLTEEEISSEIENNTCPKFPIKDDTPIPALIETENEKKEVINKEDLTAKEKENSDIDSDSDNENIKTGNKSINKINAETDSDSDSSEEEAINPEVKKKTNVNKKATQEDSSDESSA